MLESLIVAFLWRSHFLPPTFHLVLPSPPTKKQTTRYAHYGRVVVLHTKYFMDQRQTIDDREMRSCLFENRRYSFVSFRIN